MRCVAGTEESLLSSLRRYPDSAPGMGLAPTKVPCQGRELFFIDTLRRSPEIDANVRMFSCHSSNVISWAVSSEGSLHIEDCAHETLCSRRCVWSVPRDQHSPCQCSVHVCDSSDHCQRWFPHVHNLDLEEFLGRCRVIFYEHVSVVHTTATSPAV